VWADKDQEKEQAYPNITILADRSDSDLWLHFDGDRQIDIEELTLKGPVSRLEKIKTERRNDPKLMYFYLSTDDVGLSEPGRQEVDVRKFFNSGQLANLGVTASGCEPKNIYVEADRLVEKPLEIRVFNSKRVLLNVESVEPETISAKVPESWGAEKLFADVVLDEGEINQARSMEYKTTAQIQLYADEKGQSIGEVMVKMPLLAEDLKQFRITGAVIGYVYSQNLAGKYVPEVSNIAELKSFAISATPEAKAAYDNIIYKIELHILDSDVQNSGPIKRDVIYNFPDEFVQQGKIKLDQQPGEASFTLNKIEQ